MQLWVGYDRAVEHSVGREIAEFRIDDGTEGCNDSCVVLVFADGEGLRITQKQICCEDRHFSCDDDLAYHVGAKFLSVAVKELKACAPDEPDNDCEVRFLEIATDRGVVSVAAYNEHNGSYSGIEPQFWKLAYFPPYRRQPCPETT